MHIPEISTDDKSLFIDEYEPIPQTDLNKHIPTKFHLKRASWGPSDHHHFGLPPTGKRTDNDHPANSTRVRMRSRSTRNYQLQQPNQIPPTRPFSFNEKVERFPSSSSKEDTSNSNISESVIPSKQVNPVCDRIHSSPTRPLFNAYQQKDSDYKFSSSILNTNTIRLSSPISSSSSSASFTCLKGHEESSSSSTSSSPIGSSLNQYTEFTSQTPSVDSSRDDSCHPTATTRTIMTMSISPNRPYNQTHSSITNKKEKEEEERKQIESSKKKINNGCLKSSKAKVNRIKKSVHFDRNSPIEIDSSSTSGIVTSSSLSTVNDEKKKNDDGGETVKEKEKIETTRRTIICSPTTTTTPSSSLTTHTIHRSFSLSPSPLFKEEENNYNRRHRQVKKENVDELNCTTTSNSSSSSNSSSRRVTFNDHISPSKKANGMNNFNGNEMSLNTSLTKTPSFNSPIPTKKPPTTSAFFNFINRSNSSNKSTAAHRKSRLYGNKRFSADVDSLSKEDIDKVTINRQKDLQLTIDNSINSSNSSNTDTSYTRSSITIMPDTNDSLQNGFLFQPVESINEKEPFYLSPPKSHDEPSIEMMMQTSTLVISTPPQYHYYLYPPAISKKKSTTNISMNSLSTNSTSSSSSPSSYELDDDTLSYSTYSIINQKPVILSDSVQNFWPPPPSPSTLNNNNLEQIIMPSTIEQNKQSQSNTRKNKYLNSIYNTDDSLSMISGSNQTDVLPPPPPTSLILNNNEEEIHSYSEQSSYSNGCLRIASDSSLEDTQASYSKRLREKSRTISRPVAMNINNNNNNYNYALSRSRSKDTLNNPTENLKSTTTRTILRPKSAGQVHVQAVLSPMRQEISNDFQSKRQFFENRTYTDYTPPPPSTNNRIYTNSPINHQHQRQITKCSWNDLSSRQVTPPPSQNESMIRTTKYFDTTLTNHVSVPPPNVYRKPVRIVKAVQRSVPSPTINDLKNSFTIKMNVDKPIHLSSQYMRHLFPIPDQFKRNRTRLNSDFNEQNRQTDDLLLNLKKRLEIFKENQRIINDEIDMNNKLGVKLIKIIESKAELNEIEKIKLHINEIETITIILLKLSCRLAKAENDLSNITDDNVHTKPHLLEQREKCQEKHNEAKNLKDGIDRRSRLVTNILRKYFTDQEYDEYDHFIRMKSTLLMDTKDTEENINDLEKQIQHYFNHSSTSMNNIQKSNSLSINLENFQTTNYSKPISTTA